LLPSRAPAAVHAVSVGEAAAAALAELSEAGDRSELWNLSVDLIDPNPDQPRRHFDAARLEQLSASIERSGVLQPVVVTRSGERFVLLVGERRWRASRAAGLRTIPAVIADVDPDDRLELAIVENVQRQDLNPIELANAYRALADRGATQEEIGRKVGKDRSSIANSLRLLDLPVDVQADVETGRISMGHAKALLQVSDPDELHRLRDRVVSEGLSVRETEQGGRNAPGGSRGRAAKGEQAASGDRRLRDLTELLAKHFQARVKILGSPESGRIEVAYASAEDLDRVSRLILEGA
jgi:ParB family chromosome partitioning protein